MATYHVGFRVGQRRPNDRGWHIESRICRAIVKTIDTLITRADFQPDGSLNWKGTTENGDHDCFISFNSEGWITDFTFRIDLRDRAKAEAFIGVMCGLCTTYDLILCPMSEPYDIIVPHAEHVTAAIETMTRVRVLAMMGEVASEYAAPVEFEDRTYDEYIRDTDGLWFDPIGASGIFLRIEPTKHGFCVWWKFQASELSVNRLLERIVPSGSRSEWDSVGASLVSDNVPPCWWITDNDRSYKISTLVHDSPRLGEHMGVWLVHYESELERFCGYFETNSADLPGSLK